MDDASFIPVKYEIGAEKGLLLNPCLEKDGDSGPSLLSSSLPQKSDDLQCIVISADKPVVPEKNMGSGKNLLTPAPPKVRVPDVSRGVHLHHVQASGS